MPKPYDDAMKKLVGGNPQDLVSWVCCSGTVSHDCTTGKEAG